MINNERVTVFSGKNYVRIDNDKAQQICDLLIKFVENENFVVVDFIAALSVLAVDVSLKAGLSKPALLGYISNFWEQQENSLN